MKLPVPYRPKTYRQPVDWYVSPYITTEPIHLFSSQEDARQWAKTQPECIIGDVVMTPSFDWFPKNGDPRYHISPTRQFIDHRKKKGNA